MLIFDKKAFHAQALQQRGISSDDYYLMNVVERGELDNDIERERISLISQWEEDAGEFL